MQLMTAYNLAIRLMRQHGLAGWKFEFDRSVTRFGCCKHQTRTLSLSRKLTEVNDEARITNTMLHEIAHALVGSHHGHDGVWYRKAREIGCDGERCVDTKQIEMPAGKYNATCPKCGAKAVAHKVQSPKACSICCKRYNFGRFSTAFQFDFRDADGNPMPVKRPSTRARVRIVRFRDDRRWPF